MLVGDLSPDRPFPTRQKHRSIRPTLHEGSPVKPPERCLAGAAAGGSQVFFVPHPGVPTRRRQSPSPTECPCLQPRRVLAPSETLEWHHPVCRRAGRPSPESGEPVQNAHPVPRLSGPAGVPHRNAPPPTTFPPARCSEAGTEGRVHGHAWPQRPPH